MTRPYRILGLGLGAMLAGVAFGLGPPESATADVDTAKIADTIVNESANIRVGEMVIVNGGIRDQRLLEDIAVEIRKLGAHPLITMSSDRLARKMFTDVDQRFDAQERAFQMRLAETIRAMITVDYRQRLDNLAEVSPQRLTAQGKAFEAVYDKMLQRGVLQVHLGNGLYPTKPLAKQFEIGYDELSRIFWSGVNTDYDLLQALGSRLKSTLAAGREVKITAPNGTDLTFQVAQRQAFASDGVISSEDRYAGGPACQVWLPAGEVYQTPVPGTAQGTFIADTFFFEGRRIDGLKLTFKNGKLTSMTAKSDITALKELHNAAPRGRDVLAFMDIGINPNVQAPAGSRLVTWMGAGTISIGIGGNTWAGGENDVAYGLYAHLLDGTLALDGKKLVDRGQLIAP
jgi:leucyl aminopeptidase (aminopeptidase T)